MEASLLVLPPPSPSSSLPPPHAVRARPPPRTEHPQQSACAASLVVLLRFPTSRLEPGAGRTRPVQAPALLVPDSGHDRRSQLITIRTRMLRQQLLGTMKPRSKSRSDRTIFGVVAVGRTGNYRPFRSDKARPREGLETDTMPSRTSSDQAKRTSKYRPVTLNTCRRTGNINLPAGHKSCTRGSPAPRWTAGDGASAKDRRAVRSPPVRPVRPKARPSPAWHGRWPGPARWRPG